MRLSRGILALGIGATLFTLGNVFYTFIIYELLCIDGPRQPGSCTDISSLVAANGLTPLLIPSAALLPCLSLILGAWIWMLVDVRQLRAARLLIFGYSFPVIALVIGLAVTLLTSFNSQGMLIVQPLNLWYGDFALALWPLLVTLVALFWRRPAQTAPAPSDAASG